MKYYYTTYLSGYNKDKRFIITLDVTDNFYYKVLILKKYKNIYTL